MSDYYITFDRDDQPYIVHGLFDRKGWEKKKHKYVKKIIVNGKVQYVYPEQIMADKKKSIAYSKRELRKSQKEMDKLVKEANKNYKKLQKMNKEYVPPKNKYWMTRKEKKQAEQLKKLNESVTANMEARAKLRARQQRLSKGYDYSKTTYEQAANELKQMKKERRQKIWNDLIRKNADRKINSIWR